MPVAQPPSPDRRSVGGLPCGVRVCDDCCCGSLERHPDVDHGAVRRRIETWVRPDRVLRTPCLLACDRSNVVVVVPTADARLRGARPTWVAEVLTVELADAVGSWAAAGGPGAVPPPATVALRVFRPAPGLDPHRPWSVQ